MKDEGTLRQEHVSLGKMGNVRGAIEVALRADDSRRQRRHARVPGDPPREQPRVRPHLRGTHEVHTLVVGNALTGENAFR